MNKDIDNIFSGYKQILNEQVATGDPMVDVEAAMAQPLTGDPAQDQPIIQQQVGAITAAQQAINPQIEQITADLERVKELAMSGAPVEQHMDPATGGYKHETAIQQLTNQYTQLQQMAQQLIPQAQQAGVDVSALMEASQQFMDVLVANVEIVTESLSPSNEQIQDILAEMIKSNTIPDIDVAAELVAETVTEDSDDDDDEEGEDLDEGNILDEDDEDKPSSALDMLGYEPEDYEHDDIDQAAMDRVDLAKHDRPAANDIMADLDALERLVDDETRGVMEDEEGNVSRREAREIAKDIIKKMIDQL